MHQVFDFFIVGGFFCTLLVSLILFFSGRSRVSANRFLALVLFAMSWFVFQYILELQQWTRLVPDVLRTGYPFSFLAPPFAYFYVRSLLRQDTRLRKSDWLHFIPAGIGLLDLAAYFMGGTPAAQNLLHLVTGNETGFFATRIGLVPVLSAFVFLPAQALLYLVLQWHLLARHLRPGAKAIGGERSMATWLQVFTAVLTLMYGSIILEAFGPASSSLGTPFFISVSLLGVSAYLFFNPGMLYGFSFRYSGLEEATAVARTAAPVSAPMEEQVAKPAASTPRVILAPELFLEKAPACAGNLEPEADSACERTLLLSPEQVVFYAQQLSCYLVESEIYRQQGISINDLAVALHIPARQLSYVINQHYHQRFTDLINSCRVEYIIDRLQKDDWRAMTLEGLAAEAGFSSRTTFFTAFKKVTALNPTQFLQQLTRMAG